MKKIVLFIILLVGYCSLSSAQRIEWNESTPVPLAEASKKNVLDTCSMSIQYRLTSVPNVDEPEKTNENTMLLQVGKRISKYVDYKEYVSDSLLEVHVAQKMDMVESVNTLVPLLKGALSISIFKNYQDGNLVVSDRIPLGGTYKYEEPMQLQDWALVDGEQMVCGYRCQKATTTFRGRTYTAWYAPEIAVVDGPWKFSGLPGLILQVEDSEGHYKFECISIEKNTTPKPIYEKEADYVNTSREKFMKALADYYVNPSAVAQNSGVTFLNLPASANKARPYNPMELD